MSQDNDCELYSDKLIYIASRLNRLPLENKDVNSASRERNLDIDGEEDLIIGA